MKNWTQHDIFKCCKPFSVAQIDESLFNGLCVFCRLEERRNYFESMSDFRSSSQTEEDETTTEDK